jgi:hypothetical protein
VVDEGALRDGGHAVRCAVREVDGPRAKVQQGLPAEDPRSSRALVGEGHRHAVTADRVCRVGDHGDSGNQGRRPVERGADRGRGYRLADQVADRGKRFFWAW